MTNQRELDELLAYWQPILRLRDWKVSAVFADQTATQACSATTRIHVGHKSAKVYICEPSQIDPDWQGVRDIEVTLVHELLHLHAATFDEVLKEGTRGHDHLEQMIELTAQALVKARRGIDVVV